MGLTPSRIEQVADEVAEFIDIGDALYAPMKTYSAGMKARLRFAIAASARPDILLIDEALATGDASFRAKSVAKTKELTEHAGTLFLVSHSASNILEMCDRGVWLSKGEKVMDGEVREVVRQYRTWVKLRTEKKFEQADAMLVELAGSAR